MIELPTGQISVWLTTLFFSVLALSWFFPFAGFMFLCLLLATRIQGSLSYCEKLIIALMSILSLNILLYEVFNIAGLRPSASWVGMLYTLLVLPAFFGLKRQASKGFLNAKVIVAVITAILIFGGLIYPVLTSAKDTGSHTISALATLSNGQDNTSHYAMFSYAYKNNGFSYRGTVASTGLQQALVDYPQGSEFSAAWLARSIVGNHFNNDTRFLVDSFYVISVIVYSLLIGLVVLLALSLFEIFGKVKLPHVSLTIALAILLLALSPALALMSSGYFSQSFAYVFLLTMLYVLTNIRLTLTLKTRIFVTLLLFAGICTTWWFLCPVAIIPILVFLYINRAKLREESWSASYILVLVVVLGLSIYPALLNYWYGSTPNIASRGGRYTIALATELLYTLSILSLAVVSAFRSRAKTLSPLISVSLGAVTFSALLALYQQIKFGYLAYYYIKSIYTVIIFGTIATIMLSLWVIDKVVKGQAKTRQNLLALVLIVAVFIGIGSVCSNLAYAQVYTQKQQYDPSFIYRLDTLFNKHNYSDLVYLGGCNSLSTHEINLWSGSLYQYNMAWHWDVDTAAHRGNEKELMRLLRISPYKNSTYIYMDKSCASKQLMNIVRVEGYPTNI